MWNETTRKTPFPHYFLVKGRSLSRKQRQCLLATHFLHHHRAHLINWSAFWEWLVQQAPSVISSGWLRIPSNLHHSVPNLRSFLHTTQRDTLKTSLTAQKNLEFLWSLLFRSLAPTDILFSFSWTKIETFYSRCLMMITQLRQLMQEHPRPSLWKLVKWRREGESIWFNVIDLWYPMRVFWHCWCATRHCCASMRVSVWVIGQSYCRLTLLCYPLFSLPIANPRLISIMQLYHDQGKTM